MQVRLILEYCDRGSLREALDLGAFKQPDGGINYPAGACVRCWLGIARCCLALLATGALGQLMQEAGC